MSDATGRCGEKAPDSQTDPVAAVSTNAPMGADEAWAALVGSTGTQRFCAAWLAILAGRIDDLHGAVLLTAGEGGVFGPLVAWPEGADLSPHATAAQQCLDSRELVEQPAPATGGGVIAYPIECEERLLGALVLSIKTWTPAARLGAVREVHWASSWLQLTLAPHVQAAPAGDTAALAGRQVLEAVRSLHGHTQLADATLALANHLALGLSATRVAVGLEHRGSVKLRALSGFPGFDRRSREVGAIEDAMEEAIEQRRSVVQPPLPGQPPVLSVALAASLGSGRSGAVVVLSGSTALGPGAIWIERRDDLPLSATELLLVEQMARWAGPQLELAALNSRWFAGRPAHLMALLRRRLQDRRRPALAVGLGLLGVVLLALVVVPVERRVTADAVVEGGRELAITAPYDGYVSKSLARAGQRVPAGAPLAELDQRDLLLERDRQGQAQLQQERRYIESLARREPAKSGIALAAMREAAAELALTEQRLGRSVLTAEAESVVIQGDLSNEIGSPVKRGQVLFKLSPVDRFRLVLKVDERDVLEVQPGQQGVVVLAGATDQGLRFRVVQVADAQSAEGLNYFRVEAQLLDPAKQLRPGMEGVGKIRTGETSTLGAWSRRTVQWLQLAWFRWWP